MKEVLLLSCHIPEVWRDMYRWLSGCEPSLGPNGETTAKTDRLDSSPLSLRHFRVC